MVGTDIVCRLHHLVNDTYQQELGCHSSGWWKIADGRIACLVALSSIFAKWVNLQWGIVAYERGWHSETETIVLEHQMALRQLLLRFWATDHGDCHFREESLEKVTPRGALELSKSSIARFTGFTEFSAPLGSDNSHFFRWLFTKMAVSMVSG